MSTAIFDYLERLYAEYGICYNITVGSKPGFIQLILWDVQFNAATSRVLEEIPPAYLTKKFIMGRVDWYRAMVNDIEKGLKK